MKSRSRSAQCADPHADVIGGDPHLHVASVSLRLLSSLASAARSQRWLLPRCAHCRHVGARSLLLGAALGLIEGVPGRSRIELLNNPTSFLLSGDVASCRNDW